MASTPQESVSGPRIIQWYLDTRPLWPVPNQSNPRDEVQQLKTIAARELSLLTPQEQDSVLKFYHLRDAKTKLASHLLKHYFVTLFSPSLPWSQSAISRDGMGKPFYRTSNSATASSLSSAPPSSSPSQAQAQTQSLEFNVSHQAGLVSLIGAVGFHSSVDVGTDIVCVNERASHDDAYISAQGFFAWIDMHADVFSPPEVSSMKFGPLPLKHLFGSLLPERRKARVEGYGFDMISRCQRPGDVLKLNVSYDADEEGGGSNSGGSKLNLTVKGTEILALKKRRFYAYWCLREAYVKMTGEALAASWLKELEISGIRVPLPAPSPLRSSSPPIPDPHKDEDLQDGEVVKNFKILFRDHQVADVVMELAALGQDYMISGAVRGAGGEVQMGRWVRVELGDVVGLAEGRV
ncbi:unnamed protein product [Diplocarpon coronariae]|uniref:holo-[acyl-carrier-protein] synthase n=1 Tax=Diplocarpon coronariae TaxID=2795749 RepID=A0A218Z541_9HELO|nr:hypothetical protein B2J93_7157 [Marssonina coronariae]